MLTVQRQCRGGPPEGRGAVPVHATVESSEGWRKLQLRDSCRSGSWGLGGGGSSAHRVTTPA